MAQTEKNPNAEKKAIPLSLALEDTKAQLVSAFNQICGKSNLPAYLIEGIVVDILSDIRSKKNMELMSDLTAMNAPAEEPKE